jgi:hypothetical protein
MPASNAERYTALVRAFAGRPGVAQEGTGFGSSALKVHGRIFAMLSSRDQFVVKLPRRRVDALIASGDGERYDAGRGRVMKEWLAVRPSSSLEWEAVASEALAFVGGQVRQTT